MVEEILMYYDLLEPSRLGYQHLPQLTKHIFRALRAESYKPSKEPDVSPRVHGDLLLSRDYLPPAVHIPIVPRWEERDSGTAEGRASETGDASGDGEEDGGTTGVDGQ